MTNKIFAILFLAFLSVSTFAQLNGNYTIGTSGTYTSFSSAVTALNSQGVSGNVVFNVAAGTYTESFIINNYTGNSQYQVIFQSVGLDSTTVILQSASGTSSSNNHVIGFNQAKNISFKHMTLQRSGTNNYSQVIEITNSSTNLTFSSLIIQNNSQNIADDFASLIIGKNFNNSNITDITINNCKLLNGSYGIYLQGQSSGILATNNVISDNIIQNQYRTAIYLAYQNAPVIVYNLITSQSSYFSFRVADLLYANYGGEISNNKINFVKGYGLFFTSSQGLTGTGQIFNNFISAGGTGATAISFTNSGTFNIYFNSVNLYGTTAIGIYVSGSTSNHLRFANNILYSAGSNKLLSIASNTIIPFDYCNYNDYKTAGLIGDWKTSTNISSLTAWKTASSLDASSISVNPNFVSNTNLEIQSSDVQRAGTSTLNAPITNLDIYGKTRHNIKPDMGAYELSTDDLEITSLSVNKDMCVGSQNAVKISIKNNCNYSLTVTNLPVYYSFNSNTISELFSFSNLAPNDSIDYIFSAKIIAPSQSTYSIETWLNFNFDKDSSNDSIFDTVSVFSYPVVELPLDTTVCHNNSITLDAGPGFDVYEWSTQDTTQTVMLSVSQLGLGGTFVSVKVYKAGCMGKDSTLVIFKDCTGFDEINSTIDISVYPVPAKEILNVKTSEILKYYSANIIDISGRVVLTKEDFNGKMNINALSKGMYYFVAITDQGIIRKSFIKE